MGKSLAMSEILLDASASHDAAAEWRKLFKLKPHHAREIVFGYLLRLVVAVAAVIIPAVVLLVVGFFNRWQLNNYLLVFFGFFIAITILLGEHIRSLAYERSVATSRATTEENDYLSSASKPIKAESDVVFAGITTGERVTKRAFDIFVALSSIVALAPLLIVSAVAVKFDSSGPIIFRQRRLGLGGKPFSIYKFRTLSVESDGRYRVTSVGSVLRKSSLDELPQLFNVLSGDMSIVGPRPPGFAPESTDRPISRTSVLRTMKPGIVGWPRVHKELPQELEKREIDDDLWYVNNWSIWLDLRILILSAFSALRTFKSY